MRREEFLDRLIERHEYQGNQRSVSNNEITASLEAAERLTQLQKISVPDEFAQRLELTIRNRVRSQQALQQSRRSVAPKPLHSSAKTRILHYRMRITLGIAATLVIAFTGLLTAFAGSLPGDLLYNVKQARDQIIIIAHNNPQDRADVEIELLHSALTDLSSVVNDGRSDDTIRQALTVVATRTSDSQQAVASLPAGPVHDTAQQNLDSALTEETQTLRDLLNHVDWPMRQDLSQQLGMLGYPVPTVTHVTVRPQLNGTFLITLTGAHFAPQAQLMINGITTGTVIQSNSGLLVAVVSNSKMPFGAFAFGVLNPDGTATQIIFRNNPREREDDNGTVGTPMPQPTGTPGPQPTGTPVDH